MPPAATRQIRALAAIGSSLVLTLLAGCSAPSPPLRLLSNPGIHPAMILTGVYIPPGKPTATALVPRI